MSIIGTDMRSCWEDEAASNPGFAIALAIADLARAQYATSSNIHEQSMAIVALGTDLSALASAISDTGMEIAREIVAATAAD